MIKVLIVALVLVLIASIVELMIIQHCYTKQKQVKKEILVQFLICIVSSTIPTIVSMMILDRDDRREQARQAIDRHAEVRRVSIDLISEVDPNVIVEVVNHYKNNATSTAREKLSSKYDRLNYCLAAFNLGAEAYYTNNDDSRDSYINLCNALSLKFSSALDIIQYLISVPDEGVYYCPSYLESDMRKSGYDERFLNLIFFPSEKLTRDEYGKFVEHYATKILDELGQMDIEKSIQKELLMAAGFYLRDDIKRIK